MAKDHRRQWVFMGAAFLAVLGLAVAALAVTGIDPEGIRRALRLTARFSFVLFWCAYTGGSLRRPVRRPISCYGPTWARPGLILRRIPFGTPAAYHFFVSPIA